MVSPFPSFKVWDLSTLNKLLHVFSKFPYGLDLIESYVRSINEDLASEDRPSDQVNFNFEKPYQINFYVSNLGTFYKEWSEPDDVLLKKSYSINFYEGDSTSNGIEKINLNKKECDAICNNFLPFMLSRGKDIDLIPLLIRDHEELAKIAILISNNE